MRVSLNEHVEKAVHEMAPDFADFLMRHIRDTVRNWDAREMSRQIELNIGKDLQYIRINGTLVGGPIGRVVSGVAGAALGGRLAALTRPGIARRRAPRVMRALSRRCSCRPSALMTFRIVPKLGLPSCDSALYSPSRDRPASRATCDMPRARAITPSACAMKAGSSPASCRHASK